ncbi:hypothetical protein CDAR_287111 [Caerostris darwini]|uniref:Uncharacterized protein n=1 Tax=Caerostris darwini TaxID=1538125 RepID=A0AAV4PMD7_9ARAC|nr:hypothetical protein CDAR_287111 [Caerostris darwini]
MTAGHLSLSPHFSYCSPSSLDEVSLANCVFQGKVSTKRKENTKETAFDQGPSALAPEAVKKVRDKIRKKHEKDQMTIASAIEVKCPFKVDILAAVPFL